MDDASDIKSKSESRNDISIHDNPQNNNLNQIDTDDISLSQLELMANKKKLNKKSTQISVSDIVTANGKPDKTTTSVKRRKTFSDTTASSSSSSSSSSSESAKRDKRKHIEKENKDDTIRKEKSEFLYKFNKLNVKGKWSSLKLDMNNSLDDIRNEYERIKNEIQTDRSVAFFKRMLLLGVQGVEMLNTKFDPVGVDLEGWSESMGYSMENQEYDEVMAELYEKYKGRGQMSPEMRLVFMIISSGVMFSISKKITKMDTSSMFTNLLGGFMAQQQKGGNSQQQQQQQQQQFYLQQMLQQQQQQQQQQQYVPSAVDLSKVDTETSEDPIPSRLNGPTNMNFDPQDNAHLNKILQTMNDRKKEKHNSALENDSDDVLKNIPISHSKRGRGRPPKKAMGISRM